MLQTKIFQLGFAVLLTGAIAATGSLQTANAQSKNDNKVARTSGGRDPFKKYEPARVILKKSGSLVSAPSIQERIEQYKAQKLAAMNARMVAPKPTTAFLLSEVQVVGISRSPRGYAAIVEATPIKLAYVIYPGERFYDGQLVAIEDNRLVFRRESVYSDGKRERTVEMKPLRQANTVDSLAAAAARSVPTNDVAETDKKSEQDSRNPSAASREEIDLAIRKATVIIGMDKQDAARAWGNSHTDDSIVEDDGVVTSIWRYRHGELYFRNGLVYKIFLLKS